MVYRVPQIDLKNMLVIIWLRNMSLIKVFGGFRVLCWGRRIHEFGLRIFEFRVLGPGGGSG